MPARSLLAALLLALCAAPARAFWLGARAKAKIVTRAPVVDGNADDWTLDPEEESQGLAYGFSRDGRFLYVVFVPHTRDAKEQLSGLYQQDVMLWLDPSARKARLTGLRVLAPAELGQPARALDAVRLSTAAAAGAEPAVAVGPMETRGAFEARLPLAWLGAPAPKTFTFGLEALTPRRPPAPPPAARARDGEAPPGARFEPVVLWVRVTLAP